MDLTQGMVAVVRGLPDAALAVSLLDGNRHYTLVPNTAQPIPAFFNVTQRPVPVQYASTDVGQETRLHGVHCHSGAQAVDGRYASTYQMSHCNVQPTSPPVQLTEFPPQRAELCPGQGNFEVGGLGSGERSFSPTRTNGSFRGGMNWPDRGAVFTPRPSHEPDAFAKSLRKYPALSPERSSEIVERLVNYTQKTLKPHQQSPASYIRCDSNHSSHIFDRRNSNSASMRPRAGYDTYTRPIVSNESPTRDTERKYDCESFEYKKPLFGKNCDVRYLVDMSRKAMDQGTIRNLPTHATNSVHMETQADIPMVSREVATVPREHPSTRHVAVPLSPTPSHPRKFKELSKKWSSKSIQTSNSIDITLKIRKSVQTCLSSIDILRENKKKDISDRKTKSQDELSIGDDIQVELFQLIKDLNKCSYSDTDYDIRNGLLKKLRKVHKTDRSDRVKIKFGKCIVDHLYSQIDYKNVTKELSKELILKIKRHNMLFNGYNPINIFRAEIDHPMRSNEESTIDHLIKDWLDEIPIKSVDYLGRHVDKKHILHTVINKVKALLSNKEPSNCYLSLKAEILNIIENIPVEVDVRNKMYYLKRIVHDLVEKIYSDDVSLSATDRKRWKPKIGLDKVLNNFRKEFVCQYVQPTENELKQFVQEELNSFAAKFNLKICTCTAKEIELELIDILIDSVDAIRYGNDKQICNEILVVISGLIKISQQQAIYFTNNLINNFKDIFRDAQAGNIKSQTFIVLQNSLQNTSMQTQNNTTNLSIEPITDQDIQNNLDLYTQEIVQEINEWMAKIPALGEIDAGFKQVVAHDLAGDIVDRHKYLELNPTSKGSDADELEHLKYQIFKWVNKLVGEDNLDIIGQASKLMQKIQNIPVPMLTRPSRNVDINLPLCCQSITTDGYSQKEDYKSEKRTFSTLEENTSVKAGSSKDTNTVNERKKQNSLSALANYFRPKSCAVQTPINKSVNITESNIKYMEPVPTPKRSAYTETDVPETLKIRPRSTSMSLMEPPRERSQNRRYSAPTSFPSSTKAVAESQTPKAAHVEEINESTKMPSLGQTVPDKSVNKPSCCYLEPPNTNTVPSIEELNDKYDEFVKHWVQQVPINLTSPDEALEQKLRLGLYNGIWKAIVKIKMNPAVFTNPFYYQDLLDDELEELFNCLPSTPELNSKKQALKSKLIEETTDVTQQLLKTPTSYKQQLVDNVSIHLPKITVDIAGEDVNKICEDIHKLILAEDFIMLTMYKTSNQVKANVYKKKLMKHAQKLIDVLKITHGKELKDIEFYNFRDEILNALFKVPVPSDDTLREEADEILLGFEIEQWFTDLPLHFTDNYCETLNRKRYVNNLAKKIHDMEKQKGLGNFEDELRHEITRFISKLPLREGAIGNTQFMVEELVNRLKNRSKDIVTGSGARRKSVTFVEPYNYDEFSRNMQLCSSFSNAPEAQQTQIDQTSFMVVGGDRVDNASFPYRGQYVQTRYRDTPESQQEWLSLLEDVPPSVMLTRPNPQRSNREIGQIIETGPYPLYQSNPPQFFKASQIPGTPMPIYDEPVGSHSQISRDTSFQRPIGKPNMTSGQSIAYDPNLRQTQADNSMLTQKSLRQGQRPYTSRQPEAYVSGATTPDQRSPQLLAAPSGYPGSSSEPCLQSSCSGRSPNPMTFEPEGLSSPYGTPGPSNPQPAPDMRLFTKKSFLASPDDFSRQPIGFSTPQQNFSPPRESRPKKRTREIERSRREAARRRLDLDDSDDDNIRDEARCRCMEHVWRTSRMKRLLFYDDCVVDFPPCFPMRYACPYYH